MRRKVPSRSLAIAQVAPLACKLAFDGEKLYRQELEKTAMAFVRTFKTRDLFLSVMDPIEPMMKDPVSRDLINRTVEKFKEIEHDRQRGHGWLHEEVSDGRAGKNVRR